LLILPVFGAVTSTFAQTTGPGWTPTGSLQESRYDHTATLLPDGQVLVVGGVGNGIKKTVELYDPVTETWSVTANLKSDIFEPTSGTWGGTRSLNSARAFHTATLLTNRKVLVVGGMDGCCGVLSSAQLYDPGVSSTSNPIDDAQFFVRQQYLDFLNREPDPQGLTFWTNQILSCGTDPQWR